MKFIINPMGKPRMTQRDKWLKPARKVIARYWAYKDVLVLQANLEGYIPSDVLSVQFNIPMPKSWSKKKREAMNGQPHRQKPDLDNLLKAFQDCLCKEDSYIWGYSRCAKMWSLEGSIEVVEFNVEEEVL